MDSPFVKLLKTKEYYTKDIDKQIKIYTLDKNDEAGAFVIGSLSYKSGNASDVDLFENIFRDHIDEVVGLFTRNIKRIVAKLQKSKHQYFLEVKLGVDHLYSKINIGTCDHDVFTVADGLFETLANIYHKKGFILSDDYEIINRMRLHEPKNQFCFETIKKVIRKYAVLRWTAKEIEQGYKWLFNENDVKYKYTIEEAIKDKGQVNIEGIFINGDNKYVDCSNFFVLVYKDEQGHEKVLNLPDAALYDAVNYRKENLKTSMYTLIYSSIDPNWFKALKRMLSYGKSFEDIELIKKVYPIINSQMGVAYNLMSQLKTCSKILKEHNKKYMYKNTLYHTLDAIRFKLQELIFVSYDFSDVIDLINIAVSNVEKIKESELVEMINIIAKSLLKYLNQQTKIEMSKIGLYPLPYNLMPEVKPY